MSDISASERRLSAALDRIDQLLESARGRRQTHDEPDAALQSRLDEVLAENARLSHQLELMQDLPEGPREVAALVAANEAMSNANRALIEADVGNSANPDAVRAAVEAELASLKASRAIEVAALGALVSQLERALAEERAQPVVADLPPELIGDDPGVPEYDDVPPNPASGGDLEEGR